MQTECAECGFKFEREPGFYLGSVYINYGAGSLVAGFSYVLLVFGLGWPQREVLFGCLAFAVLFPVWFHRYARAIFLAIDCYVHPATADGGKRAADGSDDATAGIVMGVVLVLTILFGLALTAVAVVVSLMPRE